MAAYEPAKSGSEEVRLSYAPVDALVMVTDGLTDQAGGDVGLRCAFRYKRLQAVL